jgi:hypothetical protein
LNRLWPSRASRSDDKRTAPGQSSIVVARRWRQAIVITSYWKKK